MVRISVALATYNGERFLGEQLESLAAQLHPPFELCVGDDGSSDGTLDILEAFKAQAPFPVHIERNAERLGVTENFIATARRCTGDWIAFCDQDDVWLPEKLATCAAGAEEGGLDLKLVAHNAWVADEELRDPYLKTFWRSSALKPRLALPPTWLCAGFCQMFRRELIGLVPANAAARQRLRPEARGHDALIAMLANATGSILLIGEPLAYYRRHGANATPRYEEPRGDALRKAGRALRNNGEIYGVQAADAMAIADLLEAAAGEAPDTALLADAAGKVRVYARLLAVRASIYRGRRLAARLGRLADLARSGGYRRGPCRFGPSALAKDFVHALFAWKGR